MPTCTVDSFSTNGACYRNLTQRERLAALIYLNSLELDAIGGTSYTLGVDGTLLSAAKAYNTMTQDQLQVADLVVNYNNAVEAGASPPSPSAIQDLAEAIKCLEGFDQRMLEQMWLLLQCELGAHATQ